METNKFEQLKNKAREISLTEKEKTVLRSNIESFVKYHPIVSSKPARIKSSFSPFMFFVRSVAFVLIGILAGGSGLAYASEQSLPGDTLYPLKINVTEEVVEVLSFSPEAKLEWETKRILRRVNEIQKIEEQTKTEPTSKIDTTLAITSLDKSLTKFEKKSNILREQNNITPVINATAKIDSAFNKGGLIEDEKPVDQVTLEPATANEKESISKESVIARGRSIISASQTQSTETIKDSSDQLPSIAKNLFEQLKKDFEKAKSENKDIDFTKIDGLLLTIEDKVKTEDFAGALQDIRQTQKEISVMIRGDKELINQVEVIQEANPITNSTDTNIEQEVNTNTIKDRAENAVSASQ